MTEPASSQTCPYCGIAFAPDGVDAYNTVVNFHSARSRGFASFAPDTAQQPQSQEPGFTITCHLCPSCRGKLIWLNTLNYQNHPDHHYIEAQVVATTLLYPKTVNTPLPPDVPPDLADDYRQATQILEISPKASAALARRALQDLIRRQEQVTRPTLQAEIQEVRLLNKLPRDLADDLDSIRGIGNFAAHPIKDTATGIVIDVEPGEAEWTLEVLRDLLLHYFEKQPQTRVRRAALNKKLQDAGKPPLWP